MLKILLLIPFLASACAYNISSDRRQLPGGYDQAFLPPFTNQTKIPGIEAYFTNSLSREITRSSSATVSDKFNSEVTIEGTISNLRFAPTAPKSKAGDLTQLPEYTSMFGEYRIFIEATVAVKRNSDNKVIWTGLIKGEKSYVAPLVGSDGINSVNPLYNHSARHQYISQLAQDMMMEAVDRMTEQF